VFRFLMRRHAGILQGSKETPRQDIFSLPDFCTYISSVIIPVHNGEATLGATLESVFASALKGCEVIVVDDASTDATLNICRDFRAFVDAGKCWCEYGCAILNSMIYSPRMYIRPLREFLRMFRDGIGGGPG